MQETYQHDPRSQLIVTRPGTIERPEPTFVAYDTTNEVASADEFVGEFLTRGAANFVLGCIRQVRESKAVRAGHKGL